MVELTGMEIALLKEYKFAMKEFKKINSTDDMFSYWHGYSSGLLEAIEIVISEGLQITTTSEVKVVAPIIEA